MGTGLTQPGGHQTFLSEGLGLHMNLKNEVQGVGDKTRAAMARIFLLECLGSGSRM